MVVAFAALMLPRSSSTAVVLVIPIVTNCPLQAGVCSHYLFGCVYVPHSKHLLRARASAAHARIAVADAPRLMTLVATTSSWPLSPKPSWRRRRSGPAWPDESLGFVYCDGRNAAENSAAVRFASRSMIWREHRDAGERADRLFVTPILVLLSSRRHPLDLVFSRSNHVRSSLRSPSWPISS